MISFSLFFFSQLGGLLYVREWNNMQYVSSAAFLLAVYSDYLRAANAKLTCPDGQVQPQELLNFAKSQVYTLFIFLFAYSNNSGGTKSSFLYYGRGENWKKRKEKSGGIPEKIFFN